MSVNKKSNPKLVAALVKKMSAKRGLQIDLGGGGRPQPGFLNVDIRDLATVDVVQDFEKFPWCLPDECAETVMASHLLEHINPAGGIFLRFMDEVWRIMKPGGKFMISLPYAGSPGYWQDPTHCNGCNERTWAYFDPLAHGGGLYQIYFPKPWAIIYNTWDVNGNMEVVLEKRKDDKSYKPANV